MTVRELIAALQIVPPDCKVYIDLDEYPEVAAIIHERAIELRDDDEAPQEAVVLGRAVHRCGVTWERRCGGVAVSVDGPIRGRQSRSIH